VLSVVAGAVAGVVVYALSRMVRDTAAQRADRLWVEYGPAYKLLSAAFFPVSAFVTYAATQASADQLTLAGIIATAFWLGTLYLAYEIFFVSLSYDQTHIYHRTPLLRQRRIPWSAVTDVRYSPFTQAFTLTTDDLDTISVSPQANGARALIERAVAQLDR
jgi:hypothetical protein